MPRQQENAAWRAGITTASSIASQTGLEEEVVEEIVAETEEENAEIEEQEVLGGDRDNPEHTDSGVRGRRDSS